jgi:hypothetical protein
MDEGVQYGVTNDYFDAVLASDGIAIRMSDNVALILAHLTDQLIRFLETGELEQQRRGPLRRGLSPNKVLHRMFPNAHKETNESQAFRERHAPTLRDSNAPRRVHARCTTATTHIINHAEIDDWLITLGLARFLIIPRDATTPDMTGIWINHIQERLVIAINPRLASLAITPEQQPRTIRRRG